MHFPQVGSSPISSSPVSALLGARKGSHKTLGLLGAFLVVVFFAGFASAQAPTLSVVSPSNVTPGGQLTLTGSGFGATQGNGFVILSNARFVQVVDWSDSQIDVTVPSGTNSGLAFVNQNGSWSNPVSFTVAGSVAALGSTPLNFGNVAVGSSSTLSEVLTNSGNASLRIFWAYSTAPGITISGLNTPLNLDTASSITFQVTYAPTTAGPLSGSLRVFSNTGFGFGSGPIAIPLSANASGSTQGSSLTVTPATENFGNVTVGSSQSVAASLTAAGGAVTVSSVSGVNAEFTLSGLTLPMTLQPGQSASFTINFSPQASGAASDQLTFVSDAGSASSVESLSGTGTTVAAHSVDLSWSASSSTVAGYNVYRGIVSGGPYTKVNSAVDGTTSYLDSGVQPGQTYFYVVTAVDASGAESPNSNQAQAVVPGS